MIAEGAPDPKTADYLHDLFEPTALVISGLEKALAAVGLLDEARELDLRRPQDYFGRVWAQRSEHRNSPVTKTKGNPHEALEHRPPSPPAAHGPTRS
ncbi:hypothetical protein ACFQ7Z_23935 [Streptomyces virginiae]|uniref:hypothetical protein n=1 Tax=Streptomyces virginiae TaxID=1961 RepID=UPI00368B5BEC